MPAAPRFEATETDPADAPAESGAADGALDATADGDGRLFCYRHPDRETYVRCGRCDRPICPRCAMQGPVGFRCKTCGKPAYDPLTSFRPRQLVLGLATATLAGALGTYIGLQIGFFIIFIGFFVGGFVADAVMRVVGFKHGPVMNAVVIGGILVGAAIALGFDYSVFAEPFIDENGEEVVLSFVEYLRFQGVWALLAVGATIAGAWARIR